MKLALFLVLSTFFVASLAGLPEFREVISVEAVDDNSPAEKVFTFNAVCIFYYFVLNFISKNIKMKRSQFFLTIKFFSIIQPTGGIIKKIYTLNQDSYPINLKYLEGGCGKQNLVVKISSQPGQNLNYIYKIFVDYPENPQPEIQSNSINTNCIYSAARLLSDDELDNF